MDDVKSLLSAAKAIQTDTDRILNATCPPESDDEGRAYPPCEACGTCDLPGDIVSRSSRGWYHAACWLDRFGPKQPTTRDRNAAAELHAIADEMTKAGDVSAAHDLTEYGDHDYRGWQLTLAAYADRIRAVAARLEEQP